jgi:hypothetical protein
MTLESLALHPLFFTGFIFLCYKSRKRLSETLYFFNLSFLVVASIAYFVLRSNEENIGYVLLLYGIIPLAQMAFIKKRPSD